MSSKEERFWSKVDKTGDCWQWTACTDHKGYGVFRTGSMKDGTRGNTPAHRYAWMLVNGPIKNELCVLHKCDNPPCVNPDHLFLGTRLDNARDMISKDRHQRGSRHYKTTLKREDVNTIRKLKGKKLQREIAVMFGITRESVSRIQTNRNWKHLGEIA